MGLLRVQALASSDQPADAAGDEGIAADRVAKELAGHDGAGDRYGADTGEDPDEAKGRKDAERQMEYYRRGASKGGADEEERGHFAAAEAIADAE